MNYPTRENMQRSADYYANYGELKPRYVAWMLAMYDDLAKRDDLMRRMLPLAKLWVYGEMTPVHFCDECQTIEPYHNPNCDTGRMFAEAEAMIKGEV